MMQIWRKRIPKNYGVYSVSFPVDACVESVGLKKDQIYVWFSFDMVNVNEPWERHNILVTRSGVDYDESYNVHLGTLIEGDKVLQVLTQYVEEFEEFLVDEIVEDTEPTVDSPYVRKSNDGFCTNGCGKKVHAKGMCQACYDKVRRAK